MIGFIRVIIFYFFDMVKCYCFRSIIFYSYIFLLVVYLVSEVSVNYDVFFFYCFCENGVGLLNCSFGGVFLSVGYFVIWYLF